MAVIEFICYPKYTTCQKAKKWLDDNEIEYNFRDVTDVVTEVLEQVTRLVELVKKAEFN